MLHLIREFLPIPSFIVTRLASLVDTLLAIGYRADAALPSEKNSTKDIRRIARRSIEHSRLTAFDRRVMLVTDRLADRP
jgi:hypothetical protein